jgi:hypothetical protein
MKLTQQARLTHFTRADVRAVHVGGNAQMTHVIGVTGSGVIPTPVKVLNWGNFRNTMIIRKIIFCLAQAGGVSWTRDLIQFANHPY